MLNLFKKIGYFIVILALIGLMLMVALLASGIWHM